MELHAIIARWDANDKLTVWDKTQGVNDTRDDLARLFKIPAANVLVHSQFVGGAFGSALRTWPHEVAAILAAKVVNKPVKVVLSRADMFTSVGYRPFTWQKMGIGATADGMLIGITHEAAGKHHLTRILQKDRLGLVKICMPAPMLIPNTTWFA